jgi:hypothetical protein
MSVRIRATVECELCPRKRDMDFHDPDADTDPRTTLLYAVDGEGWWRGHLANINWRYSDLCPTCAAKRAGPATEQGATGGEGT